jgi:hypothetical protein
MKKLQLTEMQSIEGGSDAWIAGACGAIGVTRGGGWAASRVAALAGKTLVKSIMGGPVGTALGIATIACVGYGIYKGLN